MGENYYKWSNKQLREHVEVIDGKEVRTFYVRTQLI